MCLRLMRALAVAIGAFSVATAGGTTGLPAAGQTADDRPVLSATLFWGAWGYRHDRERLEANLAFLAEHGVDAVRVLATVGPGRGWADRVVDPGWPDYDAVIAGLTDLAWDRYGLQVQWTVFGGVGLAPDPEQRLALVRRIRDALAPRTHKVLFVEIANEGYQTGFAGPAGRAELIALARVVSDTTNLDVALTAPPGDEWDCYLVPVATAATWHYDRDLDGPGGVWQPAREPWRLVSRRESGAAALPGLLASNEPIGPGFSVASERDPARLAAGALVAWIAGHRVATYHAGPGVRGGGAEDTARGRPADFFDVPDGAAQLDALARARDALPSDITRWTPVAADAAGHPLAPGGRDDVYCATRGPRFVCVALALSPDVATRWAAARPIDVAIADPVAGRAWPATRADERSPVTLPAGPRVVVLTGTAAAPIAAPGGRITGGAPRAQPRSDR